MLCRLSNFSMNLPTGETIWALLRSFYYDGWGNIRNANGDTAVVMSDAFLDVQEYWVSLISIPMSLSFRASTLIYEQNGFMAPGSGVTTS